MRKNIFITAGLFCFLVSCNTDKTSVTAETGNNTMAQKNLKADQAIGKVFETGDVSGLDSLVAPDFMDHTDRGDVKGVDSMKAMVKMIHTTNKDMKMETIKTMADDEYVFSWMHFKGSHDGSMMPAGPYDMKSIELVKYKDGKAVEHWTFMEPREMMAMMSKMPGNGK